MSMTAMTASTANTTVKAVGAPISATVIAPPVQTSTPNTASTRRSVNALTAREAPPMPAVGS